MLRRARPKSQFSTDYARFLRLLRNARINAGLTQSDAAKRLRRPQSFVSKCESGERRVDVVEFVGFCREYGVQPQEFVRRLIHRLR